VTSGSLYIIGSALAFSVMTLLVKVAGERLPSQEIVLARAVVSLVLSYALLRGEAVNPWGRAPRLLVARGLVGFLALSCVYYAVTHLPLAEATVIQYLNPAFTAVLAAVVLGERLGVALLSASGISLLGVALVAKPAFLFGGASSSLDSFAAAVAVCGALFSACAYVLVRRLSATEHPLVIVFYFPLVTVPATVPTLWSRAVWPVGSEWLVLLGVGCATQAGQVWLTRGLALEPASRAAALSYLQILFATLWGAAFFGELPDALSILGAGLIVGGTLAVGLRNNAGE
jgi:drug/metabolite transporter (DMT)-like permease